MQSSQDIEFLSQFVTNYLNKLSINQLKDLLGKLKYDKSNEALDAIKRIKSLIKAKKGKIKLNS